MTHTCETCKHAFSSFFDGKLKCYREENHKGMVIPVKGAKPACEHYELARSALGHAFDASLAKARKKHPVFLDVLPTQEDGDVYRDVAKGFKKIIADKTSTQLYAILCSEVLDFLAEVAKGDFARALEEAGDVMAVMYRALNGDGKEVRHE